MTDRKKKILVVFILILAILYESVYRVLVLSILALILYHLTNKK